MKLWEMEVKINNIIDSINSMESSNTLESGRGCYHQNRKRRINQNYQSRL